MLSKTLLAPILDNEALTRGLGDAEARMLVEWLVDEADRNTADEHEIRRLCRWARGIVRFVELWCYEEARASAIQLAATQRYEWPLPATWMEPCELMERILGSQVPA